MRFKRSDHEELQSALKAVAQSTAGEGAPGHVEAALLRAFRARRAEDAGNVRRFRASRILLGLSAAAILAVAVPAASWWRSELALETAAPPAPPAISVVLPSPPSQAPPARAVKRAPGPLPSAPSREVVTGFLPLGYSGPEPDAYQVVRVRMDRSSLAQFGLPVNMDRAEEPVDADLLVGDDGVPRAVRFINLVSTASQSSQDWRNP